jgi:glucose-6-phosphate 1-epimerase
MWSVLGRDVTADGATRLRLGLADSEETRALWPHAFQLELAVAVGAALDVELLVRNTGARAFTCTGALHSYFAVSDIAGVSVGGLDGSAYLDKAAGHARREQRGAITVTGETDRIYLDTTGDCLIADPGWRRTIRVAKRGSRTTVVWNPWAERARQLADFGDDEYRGMVCVETANAADDQITVPPGGEHRLATTLAVEAG